MRRLHVVLFALVACSEREVPEDTSPGPGPEPEGSDARADHDQDGSPAEEDCDDDDPHVHPGAFDVCNGVDDDCSGAPDDDPEAWPMAYADADGDGHGAGDQVRSTGCDLPDDMATIADDCDDANAAVHPGMPDGCNGIDDDCDPATIESAQVGLAVYPTIQAAIDAALPGEVVTICDGTFTDELHVDHDLVIESATDASATRLEGAFVIAPILDVTDGAVVELRDLTFAAADHWADGGAIHAIDGGLLTVSDCAFEGNHADGRGGAIAASALVVTDTTFDGNTADAEGGALLVSGDLTVTACTFVANEGGDGGAIADGIGTVTVSESTFTDNVAQGSGGALFAAGDLTVTASSFVANGSHGDGGALFVAGDLTVTASSFAANTADGDGGAILDELGAVALSDCTFLDNVTEGYGGAVSGGSLDLASTMFRGNTANIGGALHVVGGDNAADQQTVLEDNTARSNGGGLSLYVGNEAITWTGGTFRTNHADVSGGAIFGYVLTDTPSSTLTLSDLLIDQNDATLVGGGIALGGSNISVVSSAITSNTSGSGGGLFVSGTDPEGVYLFDLELTDNVATTTGGAVALSSGNASIFETSILRNVAGTSGGAVYLDNLAHVIVGACDLGADLEDNTPADVHAFTAGYAYGASATFTCVGNTSSCL